MPSSDELLKVLKPFQNNEQVIVSDQSVGDIISAILETHKEYESQYDQIYPYFVGGSVIETAENVFNYLKKNVRYVIEPETYQTVKSPSAIIATGKTGSDCKNLSLFSNGCLDALRRNELLDFDLYYRFASYDDNDKTPQHVFCVLKVQGEEIWVDPVLSFFNQKKYPSYYRDKKIKQMALVSLSGFTGRDPIYASGESLGDTLSSLESYGITAATTAANIALPGSGLVVGALASLITSIFPSGGCKTSDWTGWNGLDNQYDGGLQGANCASHIQNLMLGRESNIPCVVSNVLSYMNSSPTNFNNVLRNWSQLNAKDIKQDIDINYVVQAITKSGYPQQAQALLNLYNTYNPPSSTSVLSPTTGSNNNLLLLGGGALVLFLILKK